MPTSAPTLVSTKKTPNSASEYEYNTEDNAQGRYTLYKANSQKSKVGDIDSQPGQRTGVYLDDNSSQPAKNRYDENAYLYNEDDEEAPSSNKSKSYYEDDAYRYNTYNTADTKGTYIDNDEPQNSNNSKELSYSYNTDNNKDPSPKGRYEDNEDKSDSKSKDTYEDNNNDSYSYNTENNIGEYKQKDNVYLDDSEVAIKSKDNCKTEYELNDDKEDGYAYNSSQSDAQKKETEGYGNNDGYGYNSKSEGSTYIDNSEVVESDDDESTTKKDSVAYADEDYESTDSDHSAADPFNLHQEGYMQGDNNEDDDDKDGYGAHYRDRTGFYKDKETPKELAAPIPVHAPKPSGNDTFASFKKNPF